MAKKPKKEDEVELRPDGWDRFEKAIDAAVKGGPKHRASSQPKTERPKPANRKRDQK